MLFREVEIKKEDGVLNKDATVIVSRAMRYDSDITIEQGTKKINAKSLMGVISLALKKGQKIILIAKGDDEEEALNDLTEIINRNFVL